jgi:hypothetical protein
VLKATADQAKKYLGLVKNFSYKHAAIAAEEAAPPLIICDSCSASVSSLETPLDPPPPHASNRATAVAERTVLI